MFVNDAVLDRLKKEYPKGSRVELVQMDDHKLHR